ncbi:sugar-binding domain-containing protein [Flavitalea sp.]|nr:glycoside hydrolase family 2 TIM barrel-domain containing protein [Flavitalea sp.]
MKSLLIIFFFFTFCFLNAQDKNARDKIAAPKDGTEYIHGEWKFKTDPNSKGETSGWFDASLNDHEWDLMTVPGNWDLKNEYANYVGTAWYRKTIPGNAAWQGKTIRLHFDGVNFESKVWINGKLVGSNNIGYLPFEFDVTKFLNPSDSNTIVVSCNNTFRLGAVWNWGGIRRPVKLITTGNAYVKAQYITPTVDLDKKTATVAVRVVCQNSGSVTQMLAGEVILSADNGLKKVLPFTVQVEAGKSSDVIVRAALKKEEVHLWNCDDPYLYTSQVILKDGNGGASSVSARDNNHNTSAKAVVIDNPGSNSAPEAGNAKAKNNADLRAGTGIRNGFINRFGLRKIEIDNKNYVFKLNGESIRVMGFNLVPDDRTTGSTLPTWRIKQDVDMMKSLGANLARLTHLPLPDEMFDYLDEKGIMVFPEIPLWGFDQLVDKNNPIPKQWLQRMVDNYYNHSSIIGWCVGNEIGESMGVMEYVEDAIKFVKSIDTTRLGVMVSHTANRPRDPVQYSDLGLVNGYGVGIGARADRIHGLHPQKTLFYSEYGYGQLEEDLDGDVDAKGMIDSIRFKPYLIGGALWTFNDYRSSFIGTKEFSQNRPWGIVDVFRRKKRAWYSFRREYAPIRGVKITKIESNEGYAAKISITPRKLLDLPAYPLKDYVLIWQAFNNADKIVDGGFAKLPLIMPGGADLEQAVGFKSVGDVSSLKIELLSPGNYSVFDTTIHFKAPEPPVIGAAIGVRTRQNDTSANSGGIRIFIDRKDDVTLYKAKYGAGDLSQETPLTLNSHIDISKLSFNQSYQVALVAVTSFGESKLGETKNIRVDPGYAPPLVYYTEAADKGFFVGYSTDNDDYVFKIQYTLNKGDYANAKTIQTSAKGVLFVPGLENGKQYFFRMSRIKDNNYTTGWSEEQSITPDGNQAPVKPVIQGLIRAGNEAIIVFEPVKKAIGYTLEFRQKGVGDWKLMDINTAEIRHIRVPGLQSKVYEFRLAALNACGQSAFTEIVSK